MKIRDSVKNKIIASVLIFLGFLFIIYDIVLLLSCPPSFIDFLKSFTHIWLLAGLFCIFAAIFRLKKGRSLWSTFRPKVKTLIIWLFSIILLICIINLSFILRPETVSLEEKADYLLLLGGGIDKNGKLPDSVLLRVEKAAEYLQKNPQVSVVVTGGRKDYQEYAEAPEIKNQLIKRGIAEDKILLEDKAVDTIENFEKSAALLSKTYGLSLEEVLQSRIVIVTSDFHLRRAERIASRLGFTNVKGIACKTPFIKKLHTYVREIASYVKLNLRILLTGRPKKL